jgi:ABC-type transport system substrate-binding protein
VPGGRLIIADANGDFPLDPYRTTTLGTAHFLGYTSYVSRAPDLTYVPYTFESWTTSPDGKEWAFKVKQGIINSDGSPVDAALIKFIVDRMVDPKLKVPLAAAFGPVRSTTVLDPFTIRITCDAPFPSLLDGLAQRAISSQVALEKYGDDFANHPVGPGPYLVRQMITGNQIVYDRNPDYTWPPPSTRTVAPPTSMVSRSGLSRRTRRRGTRSRRVRSILRQSR